jgi:methionine sulfoxide reductase catalytic subunit
VTPKAYWVNRRKFLAGLSAVGGAALFGKRLLFAALPTAFVAGTKLTAIKDRFSTDQKQTPYDDVTQYNNFCEVATDKEDPARNRICERRRPPDEFRF